MKMSWLGLTLACALGAGAASGDAGLFVAALGDWLHEPYRPSTVLDAIRTGALPGCGGATLSGSGPTVIAWATDQDTCAKALEHLFPDHQVRPLAVAPRGAL